MRYAIDVEQTLTKDQILTNYLNITFFGEQAYGIEAASERYFSVHAKDLTLPQAATAGRHGAVAEHLRPDRAHGGRHGASATSS